MRRWHGAGAIAALLILTGFMTITLLFGGRQPGATAMPGQLITTSPSQSTQPSSSSTPTPAPTVGLTTPEVTTGTTRPVSPTRPRTTTLTAPSRVVPAAPYTAPYQYQYQSPSSASPTTPAPAPTTTIVGIGGHLPTAPVTLPLQTTSSNGHVNPAFAWLSVGGFAVALIIVGFRLLMTRAGGKDRVPLT